MNFKTTINHQTIQLLPAKKSMSQRYYDDCFCPLDQTAAMMTGSKATFDKQEVVKFLEDSLDDPSRQWLLLLNSADKIIGECIFMDIGNDCNNLKQAHFRMVIFDKHYRGIGLGKWALLSALNVGFDVLGLDLVALEVYDFNQIALGLYQRIGFQITGKEMAESFFDNQLYAKTLMSISKTQYQTTRPKFCDAPIVS